MQRKRILFYVASLIGCLILTPQIGHADALYNFSFNSSLLGGGTYYVDFQLIDGDGISNNIATITGFDFGGGAAGDLSSVQTFGGTSGSLNSGTVDVSDTEFFNEFLQAFTPGGVLSFQLRLTPPEFAGGTPDQLSFAILDSSLREVLTNDALGANVLFRVDISSANPPAEVYRVVVPEPATMLLLGTGLAGIGVAVRKRRVAHKNEQLSNCQGPRHRGLLNWAKGPRHRGLFC